MAAAPLYALFEVFATALGPTAYPTTVPEDVARPYIQLFWAGGGNDLVGQTVDCASYTISVKCVADELEAALAGNANITAALNNAGDQDVNARLASHPDWRIQTVTEGREFFIEEAFEGAQQIYHSGHQYAVTLQRRT